MSLLIIEDDPKVQAFLKQSLENEFPPVNTLSVLPDEGWLDTIPSPPSVIILDRLLGASDSKSCLPFLKKNFPQSSIIVLSAINTPSERSELLDLGADDYMGKPFSIVELKSRIKALLRRSSGTEALNYLKLENTILDIRQRSLLIGDLKISLSGKEFELLYVLAKNAGRVFSKIELMDLVWQANLEIESNVLEVTMMNLRKKLSDGGSQVQICTKRNIGYWIEV